MSYQSYGCFCKTPSMANRAGCWGSQAEHRYTPAVDGREVKTERANEDALKA